MANAKKPVAAGDAPVSADGILGDIVSALDADGAGVDTTADLGQPRAAVPTKGVKASEGDTSVSADDVLKEIQAGIQDVSKDDIPMDTKMEKVKVKPDELIAVRSVTRGGFNWKCLKSQASYRWPSIGSVDFVPYDDLYQMFVNNKHYLTRPFLIVEDKRVIDAFKLLDVYKDIAVVNRLDEALGSVVAMREKCELALKVGMRELLVERLAQCRNAGRLTNIDVINTAEQLLSCELVQK